MPDLRFDDRVAVVTGGGRGLGRAYALLLASRGAKVVVNDPGVRQNGDASDEAPAASVVQEIKAAGGEAIANTDSVATPEGGAAIVRTAIDAFGRIDILIHNAGIVRNVPLKELSSADFDAVLDVHLRGGFNVLQPAFARMCAAGYGRIVMTASIGGIYGSLNVAGYCAGKGGLLGLTYAAAAEGQDCGVRANAILPAAVTRLSEGMDVSAFPPMEPDQVAPAVAYLAHESCAMSGEMLVSAAGRVAKAYTAESPGVFLPSWTIEEIAERMPEIDDRSNPVVFPVVPNGKGAHLGYSFERARKGA